MKRYAFVAIILVIDIVVCFFGDNIADYYYKIKAINAMSKECEVGCALHGINKTDLIGPILLQRDLVGGRGGGRTHYVYEWHSANKKVTLTLDMYYSQKVKPMKITPIWTGS